MNEVIELFLNGETKSAQTLLRILVNGTVGFEKLSESTDIPPKSLHRMLSDQGNPTMSNTGAIFREVQKVMSLQTTGQYVTRATKPVRQLSSVKRTKVARAAAPKRSKR